MTDKNELFIELHVPDFQTTIDFYKILGFKVGWISDEYLVMKRGKSALFFYPGDERVYSHSYFKNFSRNTKRGYGVEIILYEKDIKAFYNKIKNKVKIVEQLTLQPWGKLDFRIEDPFGFYIRIGEPDNVINDKKAISKTKETARRKGLRI